MLNMKVLDYRITSDARQVILSKAKRNEAGELYSTNNQKGEPEEARSVLGYYQNLSKALVGLQRDYILNGGCEINTIRKYREELESITRACEEHLNMGEQF